MTNLKSFVSDGKYVFLYNPDNVLFASLDYDAITGKQVPTLKFKDKEYVRFPELTLEKLIEIMLS